MSRIRFDHVAIAVSRMADAPAVLVGALGGAPTGEGGFLHGLTAIEFAAAWTVGLPRTPHAVLGVVFRRGTA